MLPVRTATHTRHRTTDRHTRSPLLHRRHHARRRQRPYPLSDAVGQACIVHVTVLLSLRDLRELLFALNLLHLFHGSLHVRGLSPDPLQHQLKLNGLGVFDPRVLKVLAARLQVAGDFLHRLLALGDAHRLGMPGFDRECLVDQLRVKLHRIMMRIIGVVDRHIR